MLMYTQCIYFALQLYVELNIYYQLLKANACACMHVWIINGISNHLCDVAVSLLDRPIAVLNIEKIISIRFGFMSDI